MTSPQTPSVSIVSVSYYSLDCVDPFLESVLLASTSTVPTTVVNNAPDDREIGPALADRDRVRLVEAGSNLGYGAGMNLGTRESGHPDWFLLANPDLTFEPGAIDELVRVGESDSTIGAVGPLIYTAGGEVYPSARRLPSLRDGIGHALFGLIWKSNPWTRAYLADREDPPVQREAGWLSGACLLVRREAFEAVGGFDDKFFMYFEDVDICARMHHTGWRIVYAPSAVITHTGGHSTQAANRTMIGIHHESAYKYLAARYRAWYLAPLRFALLVGLRVRASIAKR